MSVRPYLQIDTVKIWLPGQEVQRAQLGGNTDIFDNPEVAYFTEDREGKIVSIEGELDFQNIPFDFTVNYATETGVQMGRVSVSKKGGSPIDPEVRKDAYNLLEGLYEDYFIDS